METSVINRNQNKDLSHQQTNVMVHCPDVVKQPENLVEKSTAGCCCEAVHVTFVWSLKCSCAVL